MSVYALRDPRTKTVRYVGQSHHPAHRLQQHLASSHSRLIRDWCEELRRFSMVPEMEVLGPGSEADWIGRLTPDLNLMPGSASEPRLMPSEDRADSSLKVNYTEGELAEIRAASTRAGEFKVATWLRKISLQVARGELVPADRKRGR